MIRYAFVSVKDYVDQWKSEFENQTERILYIGRPGNFHGLFQQMMVKTFSRCIDNYPDRDRYSNERALSLVWTTLRDFSYIIHSGLEVLQGMYRVQHADLTNVYRAVIDGFGANPAAVTASMVRSTMTNMGFTTTDEFLEAIAMLLLTPSIPKSRWLLDLRRDSTILPSATKIVNQTIPDNKGIFDLLSRNTNNGDSFITGAPENVEFLGETFQAQAIMSIVTNTDFMESIFGANYSGITKKSEGTIAALSQAFQSFSTICHLIRSVPAHVECALRIQQMKEFQKLSRSDFIQAHLANDITAVEGLIGTRLKDVPNQIINNFIQWSEIPTAEITFVSDVFTEDDRTSLSGRPTSSDDEILLTEDLLPGTNDITLGSVNPKFRKAFLNSRAELSSLLVNSTRINRLLTSFYQAVIDAVPTVINEDQIFLTDESLQIAGISSAGSLFSPSHKRGVPDKLLKPTAHGYFDVDQNRSDGFQLAKGELRKLRNTLRRNILDPVTLAPVLEPYEVDLGINSFAARSGDSLADLGYSTIKGLAPYKFSQGNRISLRQVSKKGDQQQTDVTEDDRLYVREVILSLINQLIPIDPFEFLEQLDEQQDSMDLYIDAFAGGVLFTRQEDAQSDEKVIQGRLRPYGLTYEEAFKECVNPKYSVELTNAGKVRAYPIMRIPIPSGKFGYLEVLPGMGVLTSIPELEHGKYVMRDLRPDFIVTSPFIHQSLAPIRSARNPVYEVRDIAKVYKLTRPLIWKMDEIEGQVPGEFLDERSWPGRKVRYETPQHVVPWVFSGGGVSASGEGEITAGEGSSSQKTHSELTKEALTQISQADREQDRERREAEKVVERVPEPDPEEVGTSQTNDGETDDEDRESGDSADSE